MIHISSGGAADAFLEDAELDETPFGACIRRVVSQMAFPAFEGEPVRARIPLVIAPKG